MIDPAYCQMMARYNAWQNKGLRVVVEAMDEAELRKDRGAFFGSIFATLNHLVWADSLWISRFDGGPGPHVPPAEHKDTTPTIAVWGAERFRLDGRITEWARQLKALDLAGDMSWQAAGSGKHHTAAKAMCVTHFFNHQTHHRGQVHAMLTAAGQELPATDIPVMPERF